MYESSIVTILHHWSLQTCFDMLVAVYPVYNSMASSTHNRPLQLVIVVVFKHDLPLVAAVFGAAAVTLVTIFRRSVFLPLAITTRQALCGRTLFPESSPWFKIL